jgi:hypothetical protein
VKITKRFEGLKMPTEKLNSPPGQKTNVERRLRCGDVWVDGSLQFKDFESKARSLPSTFPINWLLSIAVKS